MQDFEKKLNKIKIKIINNKEHKKRKENMHLKISKMILNTYGVTQKGDLSYLIILAN